jgi:hypothetical protein
MAKTPTIVPTKTAEAQRPDEAREQGVPWRQWGPYLSERQWGTVREDWWQCGAIAEHAARRASRCAVRRQGHCAAHTEAIHEAQAFDGAGAEDFWT